MPNVTVSPNMNLPVPVVGVDPGPDWANNIDACLSQIDSHNHTSNQGVPIPPAGLNINSDLTFQQNNATVLRTVRLDPNASPISAVSPDLGCLYEAGVDLYYNDGNGNQIRLTQSGSVAGAAGTITGLPSGTASASYSSGTGTFIFDQATSTAANMDIGTLILRYPGSYPTPTGNFISLEVPSSIATGYAFTLPNNTPASSDAMLASDTSGVMSYVNVDGTTIQISGGVMSVVATQLQPSGSIIAFGGTSAPTGWLICDGTSYLRADHPALFTAVGTAYGAADGTHFNVPDLRGQFLRGVTGASGNDPDASGRSAMATGGNTGNNVGSIQAQATKKNGLGLNDPGHTHTTSSQSEGTPGTQQNVVAGDNATASIVIASNTTGVTLSAGDNETRPINAYVNFIIKT